MPRASHHHVAKHRKTTKKPLTFIDRFIYVVAIAEPLANLPQIYTIYHHQEAAGVSISSWILFALFALTWLWYGVHTKQKPMIVAAALFLLTDLTVIVGAFMYGGKLF